MFNRASRDFQPLVTTFCQMRLRNLIKISAVNLNCDKNLAIYFTLHLSAFSKPFYTSKTVEMHSNKVMWPEINCEKCRESSQKFICIRVWQNTTIKRSKTNNNETSADKMLFLWGVYFSGLVLVSTSEDFKYKENTLLFHLDGGIFSSSDQIVHQQQQQHNPNTIPLSIHEAEQDCDKIMDRDRYSTSNSSVNSNGNKSNSSSPPKFDADEHNSTANVMSILNEAKFFKVRYAHLTFPKNETQSSYTLEKLLQIQEIQREIKSLKDKSRVIAERICVKSPACISLEAISTKAIYYAYEPQKQPGMGKTLSRLLAQAPPKPEILIKSHELKKKIECVRFKIKLLTQERDRSRQNIKQLEAKREKLKDDNIEMETLIWNNVRTLNRENLRVYDEKLALQREVFVNIRLALLETRRSLLKELNEIYCVKKCDRLYTINGIHLPDAESYADTQSSPVEISIALGYVAHAVLIISRILNVPLRNAIKHEGSRSKIVDNIKILPPTDRVFPLFCRITPPQNILLYGVYLLNQNISQLKFQLGMSRGDLRATLANLWDIMNGMSAEMYSRRFVEDVRPIENSASSMDSVPQNFTLSLHALSRRKSRSLEDFDDAIEDYRENINASAPNLSSPLSSNDHLEHE